MVGMCNALIGHMTPTAPSHHNQLVAIGDPQLNQMINTSHDIQMGLVEVATDHITQELVAM